MKKITFIVNPIAGGVSKAHIPTVAKQVLDTAKYESDFWWWENGADPAEAINEFRAKGSDTFVAVGGDGTINKIAKSLVNTDARLGFVPMGSGNGLARHYRVPLTPEKAIQKLNTPTFKSIDTFLVNEKDTFVNVAGIGFDAHIGDIFNKSSSRGFSTYAKITLYELLKYKSQRYYIDFNGSVYHTDAFLITLANGSQWGNDMKIAPGASTSDKLMDVVMVKPFMRYRSIDILSKLLRGKLYKADESMLFRTGELKIKSQNKMKVHLDGESYGEVEELRVKVQPQSLNIII